MYILTVFAGRQPNLEILLPYLKEALRRDMIQEVHLWNNTRNEEDDVFLRSISNLKRSSSTSGSYTRITPVIQQNSFTVKVKASNDIHLKLSNQYDTPTDTPMDGVEYEIVLGGWDNTRCVVRENGRDVFQLFREGAGNQMASYRVSLHPLSVEKDGKLLFSIPIREGFKMAQVYFKTGHGAVGEISYETTQHPHIYLMDTCEKSWKNYYQHYHDVQFSEDILLKCDDDIVFMDIERLPSYLQFIQDHDYDLVFANTINNGVSAYYQQHAFQLIPLTIPLEYPEGGLCGTLWDQGEKANALHDYFLDHVSSFLTKEYPLELPIDTRFSINFFGYKGKHWHKIKDCYVDDEYNLTVEYVKQGFKNVLYPAFYVSHLSFQRQNETGIHLDRLRTRYDLLAKQMLPSSECSHEYSHEYSHRCSP